MSLHPDSAYCTTCNGIIPLGQFGRNLKSVCRCEERENFFGTEVRGDPLLKRRVA